MIKREDEFKEDEKEEKRGFGEDGEAEEPWQERVIQIRRVTKVVKGGKKLSFRALVAVGNLKGQVGLGIGKARDVVSAIRKGVADAKKESVEVAMVEGTIPHVTIGKCGAGKVFLKPAAPGTGVIAGGAVRAVLELAGVKNILSKALGSDSTLNNAKATLEALKTLKRIEEVAYQRGKKVEELKYYAVKSN